jgi:hypothetical protein
MQASGRPMPCEQTATHQARTHEAIRHCRAGRLSVPEMLAQLTQGRVFVPMAEPPEMQGDELKKWKPATAQRLTLLNG